MFNIIKNIGLLAIEFINSESIKKRIAINVNALLTDDEVVQEIVIGHDERQIVIIAMTNKKLYVIGDSILHEITKEEVEKMIQTYGKISKLIEIKSVNNDVSIFFKVFTKKAVAKIEGWLS